MRQEIFEAAVVKLISVGVGPDKARILAECVYHVAFQFIEPMKYPIQKELDCCLFLPW